MDTPSTCQVINLRSPLSLISSPSRIHSVHTASSAIQRTIMHTHTHTHTQLSLQHSLSSSLFPTRINEEDECVIHHINLEVWGCRIFVLVLCLAGLSGWIPLKDDEVTRQADRE